MLKDYQILYRQGKKKVLSEIPLQTILEKEKVGIDFQVMKSSRKERWKI